MCICIYIYIYIHTHTHTHTHTHILQRALALEPLALLAGADRRVVRDGVRIDALEPIHKITNKLTRTIHKLRNDAGQRSNMYLNKNCDIPQVIVVVSSAHIWSSSSSAHSHL